MKNSNFISDHSNYYHSPFLKIFRIIGFVILGIILAALFALGFGYIVKLLWNWLMPDLFGLKQITYLQGVGILILGKIIFSGFGKHYSDKHNSRIHKKVEDKWHKFMGIEQDEYKPYGSYKNWKYYKEYWNEEGKNAFEKYLKKIKEQEEKDK